MPIEIIKSDILVIPGKSIDQNITMGSINQLKGFTPLL